jgi:hypothetical protein
MSITKEAIDYCFEGMTKYSVDILGGLDNNVIGYILTIQDSFLPSIGLMTDTVDQLWLKASETDKLIGFILNTTMYWRSLGSFHGPKWFSLIEDLASALDPGPVYNKVNESLTHGLASNINPEKAEQMTNRELAYNLLCSNPWLVTLILIRMAPSVLSNISGIELANIRKQLST